MCNLSHKLLNEIFEHCKSELPNEACGYLLGNEEIIASFYPMENRLHSPRNFEFKPSEQFQAVRETRKCGLEIIGVFHSHPQGKAYPSEKDIELADPNFIQMIIVPETEEIGCYTISTKIVNSATLSFHSERLLRD